MSTHHRLWLFPTLLLAGLLCLLTLQAALAEDDAERFVLDGVHYQHYRPDGIVCIDGFDEDLEILTVYPEIDGLPVHAFEDMADTGNYHTVVFAEGITSLVDYYPLLRAESIRRVELPSTVDWTEDRVMFKLFETLKWLESLRLPANIDVDVLSTLVYEAGDCYWMSQYEILDAEIYQDVYDGAYRSFSRLEIDPAHPLLYDIDGVVFERATDTLLYCMPGRQGVYTVPDGTRALGNHAFYQCDQLTRITVPAGVTAIGNRAFALCAGLTDIQLPMTLETIGERALWNCISLEQLIIPDGVTVGENAFAHCTGLRALYCLGENTSIAPRAMKQCAPSLVVYAKEGSSAMVAAATSEVYWAEPGGTPVRLPNPEYVHPNPALIHHADASVVTKLYASASLKAEILGTYPVGTTVDVLDVRDDGWAHVWLYDVEGFLPPGSLQAQNPLDAPQSILSVDMYDGYLYAGPSLEAPRTEIEKYGESFTVIQRFGTWYVVRNSANALQYVSVSDAWSSAMNLLPYPACIVQVEEGVPRTTLYADASGHGEAIGVVYNGTQLLRMDYGQENNTDYACVAIDGVIGFVSKEDIASVLDVYFAHAW